MGPQNPQQDPSAVVPLDQAAREILKGTLVPLKVPVHDEAHALVKYGAIGQLVLEEGDTENVREHLRVTSRLATHQREAGGVSSSALDLFRSFERSVVPALRPGISAVAEVPAGELITFANALVDIRASRVRAAVDAQLPAVAVGELMRALNTAVVATRSLSVTTTAQPLGMLNLERIEMVPAGIERGELVATVPLAPGEETAVTHKEWSVTSKEFTTIVTDSLESISETGVTDNTDLSQSTTSQNQHSTQFNITGTVQGGIPIINGSSTAGMTAQDAGSQSATDSTKHATSITQKASARSRQEHKTTISTTTVTGTSETSTRILKNSSTTDPIRIDYFSLMRRWRVRLYRFGLRLTYDLVLPEPGAAMRRAYMELDQCRSKLGPFVFNVKYSDITADLVDAKSGNPVPNNQPGIPRYRFLADSKGVSVPAFPEAPAPITPSVGGAGARDWNYLNLEFDVPPGAQIERVLLTTVMGSNNGMNPRFKVLGAQVVASWNEGNAGSDISLVEWPLKAVNGVDEFMAGATGHQKVSFWMAFTSAVYLQFKVFFKPTAAAEEQWRTDVWNALYNGAQARYLAEQQDIAAHIAAIEEQLSGVDTLTLRREESDEIMKGVLKFVLGTSFDFMPAEVHKAFEAAAVDLVHGVAFDGPTLDLSKDQWTVFRQHEDMVRFINQAIEWENVVTFLYSYFWDVPDSWPFIRELRHPDATRQAFLRAGSARVVLTVRKGWEDKWMQFVQDGTVNAETSTPSSGPYLSIAQEIAAYDDRNYPGVAPANPSRSAARLQDAVYSVSSAAITASAGPTTISVASSEGFVVGLRVVLDLEDERHIQESPLIIAILDKTHIVVDTVIHPHDGDQTPFPVFQPGDKGWGAPKLPDSPSIRMDVWKGEVIASTEEELLSGIQR